ncbi:hypothetical protein [Adhaeribacter pallidiroseus]|uniref:Uncharacterized protein n=1 Tax=Adhaeribacter pallidiroseus TaxID=2072847 RepID=A0A369QN09_9BACT|nr:hypothetical protein [Adhaeribacter pallidiroseus]RDC65712.1 hypothetical protein AHMF7616_04342 [Adhaeribacter pallidiroseus]
MLRVVVVDDEPLALEVLEGYLKKQAVFRLLPYLVVPGKLYNTSKIKKQMYYSWI